MTLPLPEPKLDEKIREAIALCKQHGLCIGKGLHGGSVAYVGTQGCKEEEASLSFDEGVDPAGAALAAVCRVALELADAKIADLAQRLAVAERDAERYQWLCNVGQHREIAGSGTQVPGRGPFVAMSFPAVYAPAGGVGFDTKDEIDAAIDAALKGKTP
jgi:hypothetical protein